MTPLPSGLLSLPRAGLRSRGGFTVLEIVTVLFILSLLVGMAVIGASGIRSRAEVQQRDQLMLQVHNDATVAARVGSARGVKLADTLEMSLASAPIPAGASRAAADGSWFEVSYDGICRRVETGRSGAEASFDDCDYFEPDADTPPPPVGTVPDPPRNVVDTGAAQSIVVSFHPPLNDGGSPVTGYTATVGPGGYTCTATAPDTTCTVGFVPPGGPYQVQAVVTSAQGSSTPAVAAAAVNIEYPTMVVGPPPEGNMAHMSWVAGDEAWEVTGGSTTVISGSRIVAHPEVAYSISAEVRGPHRTPPTGSTSGSHLATSTGTSSPPPSRCSSAGRTRRSRSRSHPGTRSSTRPTCPGGTRPQPMPERSR